MGIQINGQTDIISATDGSLTIQGASGNLTGDLTGNVTGNINSTGVSTFATVNITQSNPTNLNVTGVTTVAAGSTAAPSISPTGDSNTGIFFPSADTIAFGEGGAEALRIDSSGRVGINSTIPAAKLDITGGSSQQLQITGTEADIWLKSTGPGTTWRIMGSTNNNTHKFRIYDQTNSLDRFGIDSSGRVTMPYQPIFQTTGTSYTQTNAATIIIPATVVFITAFTHSSGVFTVPVSGKYLFGFWGLSYAHGTEVNDIRAHKNGAIAGQLVQFNGTSTNHEECSGTIILEMSASDTFSWLYNRGSGSGAAYSTQWNMWGYLLG